MIVKRSTKYNLKRICLVLWLCYFLLLVYLLFLSPQYGRDNSIINRGYNVIPFKMISNYLKYGGHYQKMVNIYGNIVAFMPMGFFVPIIFSIKRSIVKIMSISALLSVLVEILQYGFNVGSFDVDDVILNTFGGILGYIIFLVFYGIYLVICRIQEKHD